jgi:hypothetical protein
MRKIIYTLFLFASFVASGIGIGKQDVQANASTLGNAPVKNVAASDGLLVFSDVLDQHSNGTLVAGHYSHRSHGSHGSHRSHYSSRY